MAKSVLKTDISTLNELILELRNLFESDEIDIEYVKELLTSYKSSPEEWKKYAIFDTHKYTRNLVDTGNGKYNLMLVCWSQGQGSSIHDHANSHCFMKILSGSLTEIRFDWPDYQQAKLRDEIGSKMIVKDESEFKLNTVAYINDSIGLHRVENRSHTIPAVSLHLYVPPYNSCYTFDERTGHRFKVHVTFHSKFGKRTPLTVKRGGKHYLKYQNN